MLKIFINKKANILLMILMVLAVLSLIGCGKAEDKTKKIKDLDFTVLADEVIPAELKTLIEDKKGQEFKLTYQDSGFLYICIGYGKMDTGGYSIKVEELYETMNAIYVSTLLIGPEPGSIDLTKKNSPSYPLVVIKIKELGKSVVFA
ncbi:MAG: protease complex subunit PrcB family protein [Lachnospiraceae bacterium]|nr:protease complex subunit PrcB family protein [Lachnospiraceae bacterium]